MTVLWIALALVGFVPIMLIAVIVFNYLVDPLAVFARDNEDDAHLVDKGIQYLSVSLRILRRRPNTVLLGNSRVRNGFYGLENEFQAQLGKWLNGGFRGARLADQLIYAEYAIACGVSRIIMFIDLPMFYLQAAQKSISVSNLCAGGEDGIRLPAIKTNLYRRSLCSREALGLSIRELRRRWFLFAKRRDAVTPNKEYQRSNEIVEEQRHRLWGHIAKSMSRSQSVNNQAMKSLAGFLKYARDQRVSVDLCIEPVHARGLEIIHAHDLWPCFEQWKRDLTSLAESPDLAGAVTIWDFSGYNAISTEAFPPPGDERKMVHYFESSHFTPVTGRMILSRLSGEPAGREEWGMILSGDTLARHLRKLREDREDYIAAEARRDGDRARLAD